jgi:hypothetical protein
VSTTSAPAAAATESSSPSAPASPSGPTVLESGVYPYRITVPEGTASIVPTRVEWDGVQKIRRDSRSVDLARTPDGSAVFIVMTDTTLDADGYAAEMAEKQRTWNGCGEPTGLTPFEAGGHSGVAFIQSCGGGAEVFSRAVVVGDGKALFAFGDGRDAGALDQLIAFLGGLEFTESARS